MPDDDPSFYAADFNTGEGTNYLVILLAENFAPPAVLRRVPGPRSTRRRGVAQTNALRSRAALRFRKAGREWLSRSLKTGREDSCAGIYEWKVLPTIETCFIEGNRTKRSFKFSETNLRYPSKNIDRRMHDF